MGFASDLDRRKFVFLSLTAAAATTFGFGAKALAQGAAVAARRRTGRSGRDRRRRRCRSTTWKRCRGPFSRIRAERARCSRRHIARKASRRSIASRSRGARRRRARSTSSRGATARASVDRRGDRVPSRASTRRGDQGRQAHVDATHEDLSRASQATESDAVLRRDDHGGARRSPTPRRWTPSSRPGKYRGPLHGIPWGVKDLFAVKGTPTTWGAADFENRVIDEDSEVVVRLRNAGAVLIAKLSTGQFAQGGNWFRGGTKNPWNTSAELERLVGRARRRRRRPVASRSASAPRRRARSSRRRRRADAARCGRRSAA